MRSILSPLKAIGTREKTQLAIFLVAMFLLSRFLGLFPKGYFLIPWMGIVLTALAWLNHRVFAADRSLYFAGFMLGFMVFKYLAMWVWVMFHFYEPFYEPFNDYYHMGFYWIGIIIFEIVCFYQWLRSLSKPKFKLKMAVSLVCSAIGFLSFFYIFLGGLLNSPIVRLKYSGYEPSIEKHVQVWYYYYGYPGDPPRIVNCRGFTIDRYGFFIRRRELSLEEKQRTLMSQKYQKACNGVD